VSGQTTSGIASVQFKVDGVNFGAKLTNAPYPLSWDTSLVANGSHKILIALSDKAGNTANSAEVTVTVSNAAPPPPSAGPFEMPSLDDEKNTYRKWGWTWSASQEPAAITRDPYLDYYNTSTYSVHAPDYDSQFVHGDLEGDDLWTYLMMYQRTGNQIYYKRAQAWRDFFMNRYRTSKEFEYDKGFLLDHLFGYGLVAWYDYTCATTTCDTAALTEAENIAAEVEKFWADPDYSGLNMGEYGPRQGARHLLLANELARVTKKSRWIALRDDMLNRWLSTPRWDEALGSYFYGSYNTNQDLADGSDCQYTGAASCPFQQGDRVVGTFQLGLLSEAFDRTYRALSDTDSRRAEIKRRMIRMAQFVYDYGLDPTYQYSASVFGVVKGKVWHSYSDNSPVTFWDPVYTTSLVNTLVFGYKLTGDRKYYDKAKVFFNRATKSVYGSPTQRTAPDNQVGHFVDTEFASATGYLFLNHNRSELFYVYAIFENGGL
jgi:hypothetical protein